MTTQREETNNLKDEYQAGYRGRAHDVRDSYIAQLRSTLAEREETNAALEAEIVRLREALECSDNLLRELPASGGMWGLAVMENNQQALSTPFIPTTLNELIEKVERLTIERCAERVRFFTPYVGNKIRALPTGQIKLEELL